MKTTIPEHKKKLKKCIPNNSFCAPYLDSHLNIVTVIENISETKQKKNLKGDSGESLEKQ